MYIKTTYQRWQIRGTCAPNGTWKKIESTRNFGKNENICYIDCKTCRYVQNVYEHITVSTFLLSSTSSGK